MNSNMRQLSWLRAIAEAAKAQSLDLPLFTASAMGIARTAPDADGRFATFKRRLVPIEQAEFDGVEWALWRELDDLPTRIAAFREPLDPKPESIERVMAMLKGWLVDRWTPETAQAEVGKHLRSQTIKSFRIQVMIKRGAVICSA